jgi:hypothetical protein
MRHCRRAPVAEMRGGSRRNDQRKWQIVRIAISACSELYKTLFNLLAFPA